MSTGLRNAAIVLALAVGVWLIPGGDDTASFVGALLSTLILAALAFGGWRTYRENRVAIYGIGDRDRALAYGGLAGIVLAAAGANRLLNSGVGTLVWLAIVFAVITAFVTVYRNFKSYSY